MSYFDDEKNFKEYISLSKNSQTNKIIDVLLKYLSKHKKVLELESKAGVHLEALDAYYEITGSDKDELFVRRLKDTYYDLRILRLEPINIDTHKDFDAIYSNKILQFYSKEDIKASFESQLNILKKGGISYHTFWKKGQANISDIAYTYFEKDELLENISKEFKVLEVFDYDDFKEEDSFAVVLKKG